MNIAFDKVVMVGLGYIGLPTAAVLASRGVNVHGLDINQKAVDIINSGGIHIVEPDLDALVRGVVKSGFLKASTKAVPADAFIIAVPTPFKDNFEPDLTYVQAAAESIAPYLMKGNLVILESTSPVGATEQMIGWLSAARPDLKFPVINGEDTPDIHVAYCPERVLPGQVIRELVQNDRVIGGMTAQCSAKAAALYKIFVEGECIITNPRTAEMCKLTENSFRDVNIAFANELSLLADRFGINVWELIALANRHPRVNILQPGVGVGGHCIAVDPWFIVNGAPDIARLIHTARTVNDSKPDWVIKQIIDAAKATGKVNPKILLMGLTFKPDIDDMRESPALSIAKSLTESEAAGNVVCFEPNVHDEEVQARFPRVQMFDGNYAGVDVVVFLVKHKSFAEIIARPEVRAKAVDFCGLLA